MTAPNITVGRPPGRSPARTPRLRPPQPDRSVGACDDAAMEHDDALVRPGDTAADQALVERVRAEWQHRLDALRSSVLDAGEQRLLTEAAALLAASPAMTGNQCRSDTARNRAFRTPSVSEADLKATVRWGPPR